MFKNSLGVLCGLALAGSVAAQGIDFQKGTWAEIKEKAAKENKAIFVDAYASWCGPCKWLSAEVFPQEAVGEFFNKNFVCYKLDAEQGEGPDFAKTYGIAAYPTLFYFNAKGELVHRTVGALEADGLIDAGKAALDPERQLYALKKRYEGGERDPKFLLTCAKALMDGGESEAGAEVAKAYLATQSKDKWATKENFDLIVQIPAEATEESFLYILKHKADFVKATNDEATVNAYIDYVFLAPTFMFIENQDKKSMDAAKKEIAKQAGAESDRILAKADYYYHASQGLNSKNFKYIATYLDKYSNDWSELNQMAWSAYETIKSKSQLEQALKWVEKSISMESLFYNQDTKAALLLKLGRYQDAKTAAEEAIRLANEAGEDASGTEGLLEEINGKLKK